MKRNKEVGVGGVKLASSCRIVKSRILLLSVLAGLYVSSSNLTPLGAQTVSLAWNASSSPDVTSYVVRYGTSSGAYSVTTNVGNQTSATVGGLQNGQTYYLAVAARNSAGVESLPSNEATYQVPVATPPTIALTAPINGANYLAPATINLAASVVANGHTITKVQFYNGSTLLGEDAASPYNYAWSSVGAGNYSVTAQVVYDSGSTLASVAASIAVTNQPAVNGLTFEAVAGVITAPFAINGATISQAADTALAAGGRAVYTFNIVTPGDYTMAANVVAPDSGQNSFFVNIDAEPADPYMVWHITPTSGVQSRTVSWQGDGTVDNSEFVPKVFTLTTGTHQLIIRGREANTQLGTITLTPVAPLAPPTIALTAPASGTTYTAPATVNLAASVTANGHTITKVQFYNGGNLLGEAATAPYNFMWNGVAAGNYSVTARVVYDSGSVLNSGTATVVVTDPLPTIALTAPGNGAIYTAPATMNLAASVTANGHTVSKVQFFNGSALLGEDTSAPYGFAWNNVSAGTYALKARAVYDSGSTVDSASASVTVSGLPAPWQTADIGAVGVAGNVSQVSGVYAVSGAGKIAGTSDSFRFVFQTLSADGEIKAQLISVAANGNTGGDFGVMIRENLTAGSRYAYMGVAPNLKFNWQRRSNTSGSTSTTAATLSAPPNAWVRLVRSGSTITGYSSTNGVNWTKVNSRSITMAANVYVGFVVASGNTTSLSTATFANGFVVP